MIATNSGLAAYLEEGGLDQEWRTALGMDIRAAVAQDPVSVDLLSPGELACYRRLGNPGRRRTWLTGRAALKRLLRRLDLDLDTSHLEFPAAGLSLSHSGGIALAIGCGEAVGSKGEVDCRGAVAGKLAFPGKPSQSGRGLGVDIEADRAMRPDSARFFLAEEERERLVRFAEGHESGLLRAWTIKEAVFKSDPGNKGRLLADYRLADAAARKGTAIMAKDPGVTRRFCYLSHHLAGWHISVAASSEGEGEGEYGQG